MLTGALPFGNGARSIDDVKYQICYQAPAENPILPRYKNAVKLVGALLAKRPDQRIDANQVFAFAFAKMELGIPGLDEM